MTESLLHGLPPVVDDRARVLILGSFPSVISLATHQYYANPQNAFWRIMGELFGFDITVSYEKRLAALQSHGVALWDVLHSCRRAGSSDSEIDPKSIVVNDFGRLFAKYPSLTRVLFNGATAARTYERLVDTGAIETRLLPSTSSQHTIPRDDKLRAWRDGIGQ